jgi:hypothetical protein
MHRMDSAQDLLEFDATIVGFQESYFNIFAMKQIRNIDRGGRVNADIDY